ncbi:hypothetical protein M9458_007444, partial [Cirrhinus mrigala]
PVIPPNLIVSPIIWNQDQDIQHATLQEPTPLECPEGKIYAPRSQRQTLLGAAHQQQTDPLAPSDSLLVAQYAQRYHQACPELLCLKTAIPERTWSHIGVDFETDLPNSE